jgi:hypothetical protein
VDYSKCNKGDPFRVDFRALSDPVVVLPRTGEKFEPGRSLLVWVWMAAAIGSAILVAVK